MIEQMRRMFSTKRAVATSFIRLTQAPTYFDRGNDYRTLSEDGYKKCVVGYHCVNLISNSVASIPWVLYKGRGKKKREIEDHPLLTLLNNPRPMMSGTTFEAFRTSYYLIAGNSYIKAVAERGKAPLELWLLPPECMSVKPGGALPAAFVYRVDSKEYAFQVGRFGECEILHSRTFNPTSPWVGMSPLEAATYAVDTLKHANRWNLALLKNSARPSVAFLMKADDKTDGLLTASAREEFKKELREKHQGSWNSGEPMVLEGGMEIEQIGFSPKDMDFFNSNKTSTSTVALVYGVPGQLAGVEGSQTFANYEQADLAFHQSTVIPLKKKHRDEYNQWLCPVFGDDLHLGIDEDEIPALEPLREKKWKKAETASWITPNEKRALTGYDVYQPGMTDPADRLYLPMGVQTIEGASAELAKDEPISDTSDLEPDPEENTENPQPSPEDDGSDDDKGFEFAEGKAFNLKSDGSKTRYVRQLTKLKQNFERRIESHCIAMFKHEGELVARGLEGVDKSLHEFAVSRVLDQTRPKWEKLLTVNLEEVMLVMGRPLMEALGKAESHDEIETKDAVTRFQFSLRTFLSAQVHKSVRSIQGTTAKRLKKRFEEAIREAAGVGGVVSLPNVAKSTFDGMSKGRAVTISRTEVHSAATEASQAAARSLSIPNLRKEWVAAEDERTREGHAKVNGKKIPLEEKFEVSYGSGTDLMEGPGDKGAHFENIVNCRCALTYSTDRGEE